MLALRGHRSAARTAEEVKIGFVDDVQRRDRRRRQRHARCLRAGARSSRPEDGRACPSQVVYEDDGLKPEVGKQKTDKLIQSDKVNFLTGYMMSHILLASMKSAVDSSTFLISANAGPSQIAGELCSPWFFSSSWQGDQVPQAVGEYMNQKGVKTAYLIAPNYAAGKDVIAGLKANFKGQVVGEDYTSGRTSSTFRRNCRRRVPPSPTRSSLSIQVRPASSF